MDDGGALHGDELFSAMQELLTSAIEDAGKDNTRDPGYLDKLTALKTALDGVCGDCRTRAWTSRRRLRPEKPRSRSG